MKVVRVRLFFFSENGTRFSLTEESLGARDHLQQKRV